MIDKNDYTIYKKYEGDRRNYNYNFDMIKDELLNITEGYKIEDRIEEYIDDLEYIVQQMVEFTCFLENKIEDLKTSYNELEKLMEHNI